MILLLRSADIEFDSRINKYIRLLQEEGIEHHVLYWPRNREPKINENTTIYTRKASYGGKLKSLVAYLGWFKFLFLFLGKNRKKITKVHSIDLDTSLIALLTKALFGLEYIYEVYDHFADSRNLKGFPRLLACKLDYIVAKYAKDIILVDKKRIQQHGFEEKNNLHIIENVPSFQFSREKNQKLNEPLKICYVGVLESQCRGLENILSAVKERNVELHVAGFGSCEDTFKDNAQKNVFFYGSLSHEKAIKLMKRMDILLGLYYLSNPNHIFASPNKYYEHLFLSKPLITSKNTPPGEKVTENNSGWVIGDSFNDLNELINWLELVATKEDILELGKNAGDCWEKMYSRYHEDYLKPIYLRLIK